MYILIAILVVYSALLTYKLVLLKDRFKTLDMKLDWLTDSYKNTENLQNSLNNQFSEMFSKTSDLIATISEKIDEINDIILQHEQYLRDLDNDLAITKDQLQEVQSRLDILAKLRIYEKPEGDTDGDDAVTENPIKDMDEIWNGMAFIDDEGNIRYPTAGGKEKIVKWVNEHPTDIDFEKDVDEH